VVLRYIHVFPFGAEQAIAQLLLAREALRWPQENFQYIRPNLFSCKT